MPARSVAILGGGLSGMATGYALARAGWSEITILERGSELGGLAGTFQQDGHFYPLSYHHILHRDRTLLYFLAAIGALDRVRWRKIRMLFNRQGKNYDLGHPVDFMRFPMSLTDKARFVRLMLKSFCKSDWSDWFQRGAAELVDTLGGPGVREAIFEPLCRLKFDLPCEATSAAWLGARLHAREGSAPLGYMPGCNWTKVLCDGITRLLDESGVRAHLRTSVSRLHGTGDSIVEAELVDGSSVTADLFVSTVPTEVYRRMVPREATPHLESIRYTAVISAICATRQSIQPEFYWMNLTSLDSSASGIFQLNSLNPTIGAPGDRCINFVTHVPSRVAEIFHLGDEPLMAAYFGDFRRLFGQDLQPFWTHIERIPMYSPIFSRGYHNPPVRSATWRNVYFAGNYRTFPSAATTGTALWSGVDAAQAVLQDHGQATELPAAVRAFRMRSTPRG